MIKRRRRKRKKEKKGIDTLEEEDVDYRDSRRG